MTAVQTGPTSITVTWTPPDPLGDTTGYIIDYTNEDDSDSGSVTVSDGSTDMETLTGLQNGDTYTISIVATSDANFSSVSVAIVVGLGKSLILIAFLQYFLQPVCKLSEQVCTVKHQLAIQCHKQTIIISYVAIRLFFSFSSMAADDQCRHLNSHLHTYHYIYCL